MTKRRRSASAALREALRPRAMRIELEPDADGRWVVEVLAPAERRHLLATHTQDEAVEQAQRLASHSLCVATMLPRVELGPCRLDVLEARGAAGWKAAPSRRVLMALEARGWWVAREGLEGPPDRESYVLRDRRTRKAVLQVSLPLRRPVEPLLLRRLGRATGLRPADLRSAAVEAGLRAVEAALRRHRPVGRRIEALATPRFPIRAIVTDIGAGAESIRINVARGGRHLTASHMLGFAGGRWCIASYGGWVWAIPTRTDLAQLAWAVFRHRGTHASLPPELVERFGLVPVEA